MNHASIFDTHLEQPEASLGVRYVQQAIIGFHQDENNDWVAELACGHGQHMRHKPPFVNRPWVTSEAQRRQQVGQLVDCLKCDRGEPVADWAGKARDHEEG